MGAVLLNRIVPKLGAHAYKSYTLRAPLETHWRPATCEEYQCEDFRKGWVTVVDTATELGQRQYDYLSHDRSRRFHMERTGTSLVSFSYPPGQQGFASDRHDHRVPVGRPPLMLVTGGDWRGNPRGTPVTRHARMQDWVDDCATHQERLARAQR
jgi:hypothetical protein